MGELRSNIDLGSWKVCLKCRRPVPLSWSHNLITGCEGKLLLFRNCACRRCNFPCLKFTQTDTLRRIPLDSLTGLIFPFGVGAVFYRIIKLPSLLCPTNICHSLLGGILLAIYLKLIFPESNLNYDCVSFLELPSPGNTTMEL